jgi:hypothetical protein
MWWKMDPKETLKRVLLALLAGNRDEAIEHLDALANWLSRDGFIPQLDLAFFESILFAGASQWTLIHTHEFGETYYPFWFLPTNTRDGRYPDIYKIHPDLLRSAFEPKNDEKLRLESAVQSPTLLFKGDTHGAPGLLDEIGPEDPDPEEEEDDGN